MSERVDDFNKMRGAVVQLINRLFREQLTHGAYLHQAGEIRSDVEFGRLTRAHVAELNGMLRGAVEAAHATSLVWCHYVDAQPSGRFLTPEEYAAEGRTYSDPDFDSDHSRHCWRDTRKAF